MSKDTEMNELFRGIFPYFYIYNSNIYSAEKKKVPYSGFICGKGQERCHVYGYDYSISGAYLTTEKGSWILLHNLYNIEKDSILYYMPEEVGDIYRQEIPFFTTSPETLAGLTKKLKLSILELKC